MVKKIILFVVGVGVLGFGLYRYFKSQAILLSDYTYEILSIKVKSLTKTQISFDLGFRFISKADISATVERLYLDVVAEGKNVGYIVEDKPFVIPANGYSDITLGFSFDPQLVLKNIVEILLNTTQKKDLNFAIKGYAKIKSGFVSTTIPIEYSTTIKQYLRS